MRADISPLIRARNALAASEQAERHGDMDEAIVQAQSALMFSAEWRDELYLVTPEKCTHGVGLDRECAQCVAMPQKLALDKVAMINIPPNSARRSVTVLCPFHTEKTPSCTVNIDSEVFNCLSCGANGSAVSGANGAWELRNGN